MHLRTDTGANAHFSQVPTITHSRNAFPIAEKIVTTQQFDGLYPSFWKFIYPGDTLSVTIGVLARLGTQVTTLYDDLYVDIHAWFVPFRLIQTDWARFQFNAQPAGPSQDNSSLTTPKINLSGLTSGFASKTTYDYWGYPTLINMSASTQHINNYLGRAYNLTWNENYRDENLQNPVTVDLGNGPDTYSNYSSILKRGKRHDFLTSMLTAQQKGTPVSLPLGTSAPVLGIGKINATFGSTGQIVRESDGTTSTYAVSSSIGESSNNVAFHVEQNPSAAGYPFIRADLSQATSATLNQVRQSYAVQHLLEADARGGTRDVESIKHRWGVTVPDFRMQRPEYLGGQTFSFDGHIVPQTSATDPSGTPQANLAQFSDTLSYFNITHSFVEPGVFFVLTSARSNITYQQGLKRELFHQTRYDFYQPEFANLGEIAVQNREWYFAGSDSQDTATAGYQEYGYWLRYGMNRVTSEMRSNYPQSRDSKHMADDYSSLPTLGSAWIQSNTPISRNIAVATTTADPIEMNMKMTGRIARTLPMYSIPGLKRL